MTNPSPAPREKELEDLAAALMSCLGYYVSPALVSRPYGASELLEADVLAVRVGAAGTGGTQRVLVEAKSGTGWGNTDLFKLLGQKVFTGVEHALLLASHCDPARIAEADGRFAPFALRAFHLPSGIDAALSWDLWAQLADAGIAGRPEPPESQVLKTAFESAQRRRRAHGVLLKAVRDPGHSASLDACGRLLRTLDDIGLHLSDPRARAGALWATRRDWAALRFDAAEEVAQGPGHSGRTPEGAGVLGRASMSRVTHPLVQAQMLLVTRVQLEITLAVVELAVAGSHIAAEGKLPAAVARVLHRLAQDGVSPQLALLVQQVIWHWGGSLRRWELDVIAAEFALEPKDAFRQLNILSELFRPDWKTSMPPLASLVRKNKKRQLELATRPVFDAASTPGLLRSCRRRIPRLPEANLLGAND